MYQVMLEKRSFFIDDDEMRIKAGVDSLRFSIIKDSGGDVVIAVFKDDNGMKTFVGKRTRVNMPSLLKKYTGKEFDVYIERLRPLDGEIFRMRPIGFKFDGYRYRASKTTPYFTTGSVVIPQMYLNEYVKGDNCKELTLCFDKTDYNSVKEGYLIATLDVSNGPKSFLDDYNLRESSAGLRTSIITPTIDFLGEFDKQLEDYTYEGTILTEGYGHIVMFFKEK